jgi:hypothetical protein
MAGRAFWFVVDPNTWPEHLKAGVAAINDPHINPSTQSFAQRQAAMAELAGIRPGDLNRMPAGGNKRSVHASAIAYEFSPDAQSFLEPRVKYGQKPIRLIRYRLLPSPPPYLELTAVN